MEHCIASFNIDKKRKDEQLIYQMYVTDALKIICENTGRLARGITLNKRYVDVIQLKQRNQQPKTKKMIVAQFRKKWRA